MKNFEIELEVNGERTTERWHGYSEQVAIAQAFLYHAQNGARKLEIIYIQEL